MRCFSRRQRSLSDSRRQASASISSGRQRVRSAWDPHCQKPQSVGPGKRPSVVEPPDSEKLPSTRERIASLHLRIDSFSERVDASRIYRVVPSDEPCPPAGFTKCAASTRSKAPAGVPAEPHGSSEKAAAASSIFLHASLFGGLAATAAAACRSPRTASRPAQDEQMFTFSQHVKPSTTAHLAAACQAVYNKQVGSQSKPPMSSKADLRAAAAANAFANLCSEMPPAPDRAKRFPRRRQRSSYRACRSNSGAPCLNEDVLPPDCEDVPVEDVHGTRAGPTDSRSDLTPAKLRQELASSRDLPLVERKRMFLSLCRQWHPDKNAGNETEATMLFQVLQEEKECFLAMSVES